MKKKYFMIFVIGIIIILIDQIAKVLVIYKNIDIIPNLLSLSYTENRGGAFGICENNTILIFSIILIIAIIIFLIKERKKMKLFIPCILILSGSFGNLIDRVLRGYVIDFIKINILNFPCFNIADIAIVLGIIWLIYEIIIQELLINKND